MDLYSVWSATGGKAQACNSAVCSLTLQADQRPRSVLQSLSCRSATATRNRSLPPISHSIRPQLGFVIRPAAAADMLLPVIVVVVGMMPLAAAAPPVRVRRGVGAVARAALPGGQFNRHLELWVEI